MAPWREKEISREKISYIHVTLSDGHMWKYSYCVGRYSTVREM